MDFVCVETVGRRNAGVAPGRLGAAVRAGIFEMIRLMADGRTLLWKEPASGTSV